MTIASHARRVLDEPSERGLRGRSLEAVGVVDDEQRPAGSPRLQRGRRVLDGRPAAGHVRQRGPHRGFHVADHRRLVGIPRLGPVPGDGDARPGREVGQQGGLAGSGRGDDDAEAPLPDRVEEGLQPLPRQGRRRRHAHLRRYNGRW